MVKNCTWFEDVGCHFFFATYKTKDDNISSRSLIKPAFSNKSIINFCVKTTKRSPFIEHIHCPKLNMLTHFSTSLANIFQLLIINFKKLRFQNWLDNKKFIINPLNNLIPNGTLT